MQIITDAPLQQDMHVELWPEDEMGLHLRDYAEGTHYVHGDVCWAQKSPGALKNLYGISFKRQINWPIPMQALSENLSRLPQEGVPSHFVLDNVADGIFTVDTNWRITSFNKAAETITGFSRQAAIGSYCSDIFHSSICGKSCAIAASISSGEPDSNRCIQIRNMDNEQVPVSISAAPLYDNQGNLLGGVETFRDLRPSKIQQYGCCKQNPMGDIISHSPAMSRIFEILPRIAESDSNVLIIGESGTGKEVLAKALHKLSDRSDGPLITVNCGALPDTLLESELFGCKAGAYTDAKTDRIGRIAAAEGGTLFLDEIGEISLAMQVKLLRVLETRLYEPLGSNAATHADIRILAATNSNLAELMQSGHFREDLFYRLNVVKIEIPTLRDRLHDIPLLLDHFIKKFNAERHMAIGGLADETLRLLMQYDFPGNIRELQNIIEYAFILCSGGLIYPEHLPATLKGPTHPAETKISTGHSKPICLDEIEKQAIFSALRRNNWKRMKTCRELGISKDTLRRKISRYKLLGRLQQEKVA